MHCDTSIHRRAPAPITARPVSSTWRRWVATRQKSLALPEICSGEAGSFHSHWLPSGATRVTYGLTGGHILHGEPALDQLFTMRPVLGWAQYRTPIDGLFLCGSGTHPGGGLTAASGHNASREIIRAIKKRRAASA